MVFMALVGCSKESSTVAPSVQPTTTTTVYSGPVAPLTGLPTPDHELADKPLLTVKIDNHPDARPQFGLDRADVIVEEKVEGGLSRFMALFHSQESGRAGPVRSLRSTDARWLRAEGGLMAYSGAIPPVRRLLPENGIVDIGADSNGPRYYKRRSDRPFEHAMYVDTSVLRELTPPDTKAAKPLFQYLPEGSTFSGAGVTPVNSVSGRFAAVPTATTFEWAWDAAAGVFRRTTNGAPHDFEGVGQVGMTNVVIQFTKYQATPFRDRANAAVDEAIAEGTGEAWMLSGGQLIKGRWNRPTLDDKTAYTDNTGVAIKLRPGRSWVMLMPAGQPVTVQ